MVKFFWSLYKTSILAFILIIINEKSIFGPFANTLALVSGYQQFFRVRPSDQEVIEGNEVLLQCQVANQAGLVQWSKDGFALGFDPDIPGWPRYSMIVDQQRGVYNLNIKNLQLFDEGDFECQVGPAQDNRAIRSNARINVLVPPQEIVLRSANRPLVFNATKQKPSHIPNTRLEVREAERIKLVCNTSTPTKPITQIKWFKNGVPLSKESYSLEIKDGLGTYGKLFVTFSVISIYTKLDDNGVKYSCQGEHPALIKPMKSSITLSVLYPPGLPTIEGYTSGDVISVGDTLHLACISSGGNPLAKLIWYKESQEVDNTYSSGGGRESTNIFSFTVSPGDNNAVYKCEATNDVTNHPLIAFTKLKVLFAAVKVDIIGPKQGKIGDTITLMCLAGPANPSADVSWSIEGRSVLPLNTWTTETKEGWISGANITFNLSNQDMNSISVSCSAVSETLGETMVQSFIIDILYPPGVPYIMGYEDGTNLAAGELYRFKCVSMGGNPLPTLRWQVMSVGTDAALDRQISALTSITGSGVSSELVIRAQSSDNGATYKCEASNAATLRPLNTSIKLSVFYMTDSVEIKIRPKNPKTGELVNLVCDSGPCNPKCDLFWYKNNNKINGQYDGVTEMDIPFGGKNTRTKLQLNVSTKDDESAIICEAVNQFVNKSMASNVTIRVLYKPEFVGPPFQKFDVTEGSDISVNLSARGNPSIISYQWTKDSLPLFDISDAITTMMSNSLITQKTNQRPHQLITEGPVLTIKNVRREDSGDYDCQASNSEGLSKTTVTINVLFGPLIVDISKTVFVDSGESASLYCMAVGNPMNDEVIEWRREGMTNLMKDTRINVKIEKGRTTLWISNVNPHIDVGEYECRANNGIGKEAIERVRLLVKTKPEIILNMTTTIVATDLAQTTKLVCSATGVPKVQFKWMNGYNEVFSEDQIPINNDINYFGYSLQKKQISESVFQSALTIKRITDRELNKSFKCIAQNEKGETETDIRLRKRGKPDPPNDIKVINITHNSVFLSWRPGFDGGVKQSFRIMYNRIETNNYEVKESDKNWILINGLETASEYILNVISFNTFGETDWKNTNNSIHVWTYATEFDSSEPLIDGLNPLNTNPDNKSVSTIIMIIVFVLGLILIILNASLVICYFKWKKHIQSRKNQTTDQKPKPKTYSKATTNGTTILMKTSSEEDMALANLVPISDQSGKRCEVLLMTELDSSSSSSLPQPVARVLLTDCHISNASKRLSLETDNCPDIIKNPIVDNNIMDSTNYGDLNRQQMNNYCNNIEVVNNSNNSVIYNHNNRIQAQNSDKFQLKSILKNGSLKKQEIHLL